MPVSVGAPRQLLRRLREVMAERESAQVRLDKVGVLIASNLVAEVCSLYLAPRGGPTSGVRTVQNRTKRQYSDEEIEALQTTAMVLAEMIASGGLVSDEVSAEGRRELAARVTGLSI